MATMNVSLPDQMKAWVEESIQSGRYANASDYVRDLIRQDHTRIEAIRLALIEGEADEPEAFNIDDFISYKKQAL